MEIVSFNNAVRKNDTESVLKLLNEGVNINQLCSVGGGERLSPLMVACQSGHLDIVKLLLSKGAAEVNLKNGSGWSAFLKAIQFGRVQVAKLLIDYGAEVEHDVQIPNSRKKSSALMIALEKEDMELVDLLLEKDTRVVHDVEYRKMLAQRAIEGNIIGFVRKLFLNDAESVSNVLNFACSMGNIDMVKILLECDYSLIDVVHSISHIERDIGRTQYNDDKSALMVSCEHGYTKIAELLLDCGANLDIQNSKGETALMYACRILHYDIVKLLVERGAQVNLKEKRDECTALMSTIEMWHSNYKDTILLIVAVLAQSADVNILSRKGTALTLALQKTDSLPLVRLLLDKAQTDLQTWSGLPLQLAIEYGHDEVAKQLLKKDSLVNLQEVINGRSPLMVACKSGNTELVQLLLENGAKIDLLDHKGSYALLYVVKAVYDKVTSGYHYGGGTGLIPYIMASLELIEILLDKGAIADIIPNDGESAASILHKLAPVSISIMILSTVLGHHNFLSISEHEGHM